MSSGEQYILRMIVDVKNDKALQALEKSIKSTGAALPAVNKQLASSGKAYKNMGYQVQNASYQLTDFIVQIEGGVSAGRAFAQQAPQLLAGFGAVGASVGVLAALLPTVWILFQNGKKKLDEFNKSVDDTVDYVSILDQAFSNASSDGGLDRYLEAFKTANEGMRSEIIQTANITKTLIENQLLSQMEKLRELASTNLTVSNQDMNQYLTGKNIARTDSPEQKRLALEEKLTKQYELEAEAATKLVMTLEALANPNLQPDEADRLLQTFLESTGTVNDELTDLLRKLQTLREQGKNLQGLKDFIADPTAPTKKDLEDKKKSSSRLSDEERRLAALEREAAAYLKVYDPMENYRRKMEEINLYVTEYGLTQDAAAILAAKAYEEMQKSAEQMGDIYEELESFGDVFIKGFDQAFNSFVDGLASGTAEVEDLFENMVKSLIAQLLKLLAYKAVFAGFGVDLSSGSIPWVSGQAQGGAWQNGVQMFAKGGVVSGPTAFGTANGVGLMGEAGPEAIMPLSRMAGGDLGVKGQPVNVTVNNNASGASVTATPDGNGGLTIDIIERALVGKISQGGSDLSNAMQNMYGLSRQGAY